MRHLAVLSLLLTLLAASCTEPPTEVIDGSGDFAMATFPIFGGSPPNQEMHKAVVSLHQVSNGYVYASPFCSGTLIADDVVLTAAHCLTTRRGKKVVTMSPSSVAVYVGDQPSVDILDHLYAVTDVTPYPRYRPATNAGDLGLLRLHRPVVEDVTPVEALPASLGFTESDIGQPLNFAGFGKTESGSIGVKLQVDVPLGGFGCSVYGCPDGGDAATMISYTQPTAGPCSGDSGGPAFLYRGTTPYVAGVTSYGDSYCTIYGVSTRTDAFDSFIDAYVNVPDCSSDGVCNEQCEADPDCTVSIGCGDGVCGAGESCDGRDGTAACEADCAGKTGGKPTGRYCFVEGICVGPGCK